MFGQEYTCEKTKQLKTSLPDFQDYMVCIQVEGKSEEGELILTFNSSTAENLLQMIDLDPSDVNDHKSLLHSALGELANVVAGQLMTCPSFKDYFGSVKISPPFIWDSHCPEESCIPLRMGFKSSICKGDRKIQTFICSAEAHSANVIVLNEIT